MRQTLPFLLLFTLQTLYSQSINQRLQQHQEAYPLEKIYISHNQPHYAPGDTLYGKVFLVNGRSHQYFDGTPIVYVDWMTENGEVLDSFILKIKEGTADLAFPIVQKNGAGRFLLRAYTQYQKNFDDVFIFQKEIKIIGEKPLAKQTKKKGKSDFLIQFFPEGGRLVAGLKSVMAFRTVNEKGEPIDVRGEIVDKNNRVITQFKTMNEGIGIINFEPQNGKKYRAKITRKGIEKVVDLPKMLKEGYVLKINNRQKDNIRLEIKSNTKSGLKGCILIGHLRGQVFLNQRLTSGSTQKLVLEKAKIPSGVLHFTLFDRRERPVCERLVFNNNPLEEVELKIELAKAEYGTKEQVHGLISGQIGEEYAKGKMTIAVYNKNLFPKGTAGTNIKNHFLLQSDLCGRINNINQYFEVDDAKSRTLLDYVMLTQGWRRFNWQDVLASNPMPIIFPTEESISFAGKVTKDNSRGIPVKADVFLNILDGKHFAAVNLTTEEDGLFYFKGFDLPDSAKVLIQGNIYNPKKRKKLKEGEAKRTGNKNVQFQLLNLHKLAFNDSITLKGTPYTKEKQTLFAKEVNRIRKVDTIYHPEWSINLEAVTVKANRIDQKRKREKEMKNLFKERGLFYSDASEKVYMEDLTAGGAIYTSVFDIIRDRIGGVQFVTTIKGKEVLLRPETSIKLPSFAVFEVDGVRIDAISASLISPATIAMIDVKKGLSATSVYGASANGGIISIITKDPSDYTREVITPGILTIKHPGYHKARTFYTPDYNDAGIDKEKPDYRTALYWNPDGIIGKEPSPIQFYTGDKLSEFLIFVEGITEEGIPFIGKRVIKVGK